MTEDNGILHCACCGDEVKRDEAHHHEIPPPNICPSCHVDMSEGEDREDGNVTCLMPVVMVKGHEYRRRKDHFEEEDGRCHDCGIRHGGIHHIGCDVELCPVCDDQMLSCNCDKEFPIL